jgi:small subunit ribosomal protein S4
MSHYRGARLRIIRRLGKLSGLTNKINTNSNLPGQHGKEKKKVTEYRLRLEEKQKLKFNYGLTENQLYNYITKARRSKSLTSLVLIQLLQTRLDSICFSLGLALTIIEARQIINHGHILVNEKKVTVSSFQCYPNDTISIKKKENSQLLIQNNLKKSIHKLVPNFLEFDKVKFKGLIKEFSSIKEDIVELNELLVLEYYAK